MNGVIAHFGELRTILNLEKMKPIHNRSTRHLKAPFVANNPKSRKNETNSQRVHRAMAWSWVANNPKSRKNETNSQHTFVIV